MENTKLTSNYITAEKIIQDISYHRAQEIIKRMLDLGVISLAEYNKTTEINRRIFSPMFAEIMPEIT